MMTTEGRLVAAEVLNALKSGGAVVDSHPFPVGLDRLSEVEVGWPDPRPSDCRCWNEDCGLGSQRVERDVTELIDARNGSGMSSLAVRGHNGCILFAVLSQF